MNITGDFPAIVTINPYLQFVKPSGDLYNIKACRVKWVCCADDYTAEEQRKAVLWSIENNIPALITFMRFKSYSSLDAYAERKGYVNNAGWLRPTMEYRSSELSAILTIAKTLYGANAEGLIYTCDMSGHGCPSCNNCIRLIVGDENVDKYEIKSLNLSTSGDKGKCIFNCPDCWAKNILKMTKNKTPKCDILFANRKQKGEINHE